MHGASFMKRYKFCLLPKRKRRSSPKRDWTFAIAFLLPNREIKDLTPDERYAIRQERSRPIVEAFLAWLRKQRPQVLPKSALGKAIDYCLNQWGKLTVFPEDGRLELDNNRSERSIKPFAIGRKNCLFANTPRGAWPVPSSTTSSRQPTEKCRPSCHKRYKKSLATIS